MDNFIFGQYFPGSTFIYRLNPTLKLMIVILLIVASFMNQAWIGFVILLGICGLVIQMTQVGWHFFLKGTKFFIYIIFLTSLIQVLFSSGEPIFWHWGIFTISGFGLQIAILAFLRFLIAIVIFTVYLMTTNPVDISQTIQRLCYPLKFVGVNLDDIGLVTVIALRFVPTLTDEVNNIKNAQVARGINYQKRTLAKRINHIITILIPLFMDVFRRAEQLAAAMILRGYTDGKQRTHLRKTKVNKIDWLIFAIVIIIFSFILAINQKN